MTLSNVYIYIVSFCVSHRRWEMYIGHTRPCVCVSVRSRMLYCCMDSDV